MHLFPRTRIRMWMRMLGIASISAMSTLACVDASPSSVLLAPSPVIVPDAVTVSVGAAQVFSVQNVTVVGFDVTAEQQNWSECIAVDATFVQANSIRLVARGRCRGRVFVSARIGDKRSPVVAVMQVQGG